MDAIWPPFTFRTCPFGTLRVRTERGRSLNRGPVFAKIDEEEIKAICRKQNPEMDEDWVAVRAKEAIALVSVCAQCVCASGLLVCVYP